MGISAITYESPGVRLLVDSGSFVRWVIRERRGSSLNADWRAEKIKDFIDGHSVGHRLSIEKVCEELGLPTSPRQARRLFQILVGMGFRKYAKNKRLAFAARQLEVTEEPVKVIALEIGYRRTAEFTRSFKELFRLSPLEFRRIWSRREYAAQLVRPVSVRPEERFTLAVAAPKKLRV
jgi:AraC-like DNA-binding protein